MGLDGVELLLEVEERFEITIEDEEAAALVTVGDLSRLVMANLTPRQSRRCVTSYVFYRLRHELRQLLGADRFQVRPATALEEVLSQPRRRSEWSRLSRSLGWELPSLRRPRPLVIVLSVSLTATFLFAVNGGAWGLISTTSAWLLAVATIAGGFLAHRATAPLAVWFPSECHTVGQATHAIVAMNFGRIATERQSWQDNEVWAALRQTIVDQLGVDPEDVTPNARFVEDLGLS